MEKDYVKKALDIALPLASNLNLKIEKVEWVKESDVYVLRFIASNEDESLDIDEATALNEAISEKLDEYDFIEEEYMLEVSSLGAERELENGEDIIKNIGKYIHIDFNKAMQVEKYLFKDIEGILDEVKDNKLVLSINLKGKIKKVEIEKENMKLIRKAIKF